jgi:hypothetical protein
MAKTLQLIPDLNTLVFNLNLNHYEPGTDSRRSMDVLLAKAMLLDPDKYQSSCDPNQPYTSCATCLPLTRSLMSVVTSTTMTLPAHYDAGCSAWYTAKRKLMGSLIATTVLMQQAGHNVVSDNHGVPRSWGTLSYCTGDFERDSACRQDILGRLPSFYPSNSVNEGNMVNIPQLMRHDITHFSSCKDCDDLFLIYVTQVGQVCHFCSGDNRASQIWEEDGRDIIARCAAAHTERWEEGTRTPRG